MYNPSQAANFVGQTARTAISNPVGTAKSFGSSVVGGIAQGARQSIADLASGDDDRQNQGLANGLILLGSFVAPEGRAAAIPDEALIVRGGGLVNQTAGKINEAMAKSASQGINGFSVQCSATCVSIDQLGNLGQYLRNSTAGAIRRAGGTVVNTGSGSHATVFGLTGEQASPLLQNIFINPNPRP